MATINSSWDTDPAVSEIKWLSITETDTGAPVRNLQGRGIAVQTVGDFTTSGAVTLEGSNDGVTYVTLKDRGGTSVVMIAATTVWYIIDFPALVRPRATAGSSVSMDVYMHVMK